MENRETDDISRILAIVTEILEEVHYLKEHRSMLEGDPLLEFSEVCQMLRQSERQVRRYREQGRYGFANHAYSHLLHRLGSLVFLYGPDSSENIKKETAKDEPLFVIMVYSVVLFILFEFETMILYFNTRLLQEETA